MRVLKKPVIGVLQLACPCRLQHEGVSRETVLARWNACTKGPQEAKAKGRAGKGMMFASNLSSSWAGQRNVPISTKSKVSWVLRERMDYYVQYSVPSNWVVVERVSDNSIAVQCRPPVAEGAVEGPTVHGLSLNCFAYKQKVKDPDCAKLLSLFLRRFNTSVLGSLVVLSTASGHREGDVNAAETPERTISDVLASRLNCAVAEITFTPDAGGPLAHGLCRAFYSSNHRFHYVVVVAVPHDEFGVSGDLLTHALLEVAEGRAEVAPKRT
uniref:Uncharacterized protein n=1 Tax=Trypanosoma congolense (strain IL3000) TaxID=1068625 RepID=G0UJ28_TRYCI|nr:conserved hypothetical protein [Trypanosoma congolense IL3000]